MNYTVDFPDQRGFSLKYSQGMWILNALFIVLQFWFCDIICDYEGQRGNGDNRKIREKPQANPHWVFSYQNTGPVSLQTKRPTVGWITGHHPHTLWLPLPAPRYISDGVPGWNIILFSCRSLQKTRNRYSFCVFAELMFHAAGWLLHSLFGAKQLL